MSLQELLNLLISTHTCVRQTLYFPVNGFFLCHNTGIPFVINKTDFMTDPGKPQIGIVLT